MNQGAVDVRLNVWAFNQAALALYRELGDFVVVDRRRIELVEDEWARQPYHAAEDLKPDAACDVVKRGVEAAHQIAIREMRAALKREEERGHDVAACAVLVVNPMPDWSVEQILAVHFRMHKAEGVLFRDALARAAEACGVKLVAIPEEVLAKQVELAKKIAALGKKDGALAAMVALQGDGALRRS